MLGINDCGVAEAVTVSVWFSPPELMPVRNTVRAPESSAIVRLANPARVGGMFGVTPFVVVNAISEEYSLPAPAISYAVTANRYVMPGTRFDTNAVVAFPTLRTFV